MTRLVQIQKDGTRRVALVEEPHLRLVEGLESVYELVTGLDFAGLSLTKIVNESLSTGRLDYEAVYSGNSDWHLLPAVCHPWEPARCLVSGTGLTHLGSAQNRQAMHGAAKAELNDSMKMFQFGLAGGKPAPGKIGVAPEWFYKGNGTILRAHGEPLDVPPFAEDGGEEAEIAGVYFIDANGRPRRIGMAIGNEFSDHKFEKKNYLNLAGSKIRTCSLGPELVIDPRFESVPGRVTIQRAGRELWSKEIVTGEKEMCHSLANIEQHHFKFETHRRPGDLHVHFFGACALSFGDGVQLADSDMMEISFAGFGRALRNSVKISRADPELIAVQSLI